MKGKLEVCLHSLDELEAKLNEVLSSMDQDQPVRFRIDEALSFIRQATTAISEARDRIETGRATYGDNNQ